MTAKYISVAKSCICRIYISLPWGFGVACGCRGGELANEELCTKKLRD